MRTKAEELIGGRNVERDFAMSIKNTPVRVELKVIL